MLLDRCQLMCCSKTQLWLLSGLATACPLFTIARTSSDYMEQWPQQDWEASVMKLYWFFLKYGWSTMFRCTAKWFSYTYISISAAAAAAKLLQSCLTLCDPIDGSPPGFPIPGILLARTLEWVAISFSNAGKWKVKVKLLSRVQLLATPWTAGYQAPLSMGFSRQESWSGLPLPSPYKGYKRCQMDNRFGCREIVFLSETKQSIRC